MSVPPFLQAAIDETLAKLDAPPSIWDMHCRWGLTGTKGEPRLSDIRAACWHRVYNYPFKAGMKPGLVELAAGTHRKGHSTVLEGIQRMDLMLRCPTYSGTSLVTVKLYRLIWPSKLWPVDN